jgi:hypothetical protein
VSERFSKGEERTMKRRVLFACAAAVAVVSATAPAAQAPPPTVVATVTPQAVTLQGAEALPAGATRFEIRNGARRGDADVNIVALKPGVTVDAFRAALGREGGEDPRPFKRILSFEANGIAPAGGRYATTINLKPGLTYVVLNTARRLERSPIAVFTVGQQPSGAVAPAPAATVGVVDYAFRMPSTLPRRGVVRFENRGERLHFGVAFRVRPGVRPNRLVRLLRSPRGSERQLERLVGGATQPLGIVSGGTVNDVEVNFRRPGNWVLACFIEDGRRGNPPHNLLGMVRSFRVR